MKCANAMLTILVVSSLWAGCASRRAEYVPPVMSEPVAGEDTAQWEAQLRELVQRRRIQAAHARDEAQQTVKRKPPYFFKEYASYPESSDIRIELQHTESRSNPLRASVEVPKVRFTTRLHRSRDDALRDTDFFRDTGRETQEYILRNGRWVSIGNTFVADVSEMQVNGQWVPLREEESVRDTPEADVQGGWFRRAWDRVTGD